MLLNVLTLLFFMCQIILKCVGNIILYIEFHFNFFSNCNKMNILYYGNHGDLWNVYKLFLSQSKKKKRSNVTMNL